MPITPLHLAAGFPVKHWQKEYFSMSAFILVNIVIDLEPAFVIYLGLDYPLHGPIHTLAGGFR